MCGNIANSFFSHRQRFSVEADEMHIVLSLSISEACAERKRIMQKH